MKKFEISVDEQNNLSTSSSGFSYLEIVGLLTIYLESLKASSMPRYKGGEFEIEDVHNLPSLPFIQLKTWD